MLILFLIFRFPHGVLEKVIIGERILFSEIIVMAKGPFIKIKGAMFLIEIDNKCNALPRSIDSNGLILLKLKICI